jgi:hypothetical protein
MRDCRQIFQTTGITITTALLRRNDDQKSSETSTGSKKYQVFFVALNGTNRRHLRPELRG